MINNLLFCLDMIYYNQNIIEFMVPNSWESSNFKIMGKPSTLMS